jgi:hypothetical protein
MTLETFQLTENERSDSFTACQVFLRPVKTSICITSETGRKQSQSRYPDQEAVVC